MPRPINYVVKMRKWARSTNGDEGLKLALLNTLNLFNSGDARLEEVNKMVKEYSKTISKVSAQESNEELDQKAFEKELDAYLADDLEN